MSGWHWRFASCALVAATALAGACGPKQETVTASPPPRDQFPPVADVLIGRCGSLDCHGQVGRNLQLWGADGMRFSPNETPDEGQTTPEEYDASFWSVVALEPERLAAVVVSGGAAPERLSMIKKARGTEHHVGGTLMHQGDDVDVCLTSWLASSTDVAACERGTLPK